MDLQSDEYAQIVRLLTLNNVLTVYLLTVSPNDDPTGIFSSPPEILVRARGLPDL